VQYIKISKQGCFSQWANWVEEWQGGKSDGREVKLEQQISWQAFSLLLSCFLKYMHNQNKHNSLSFLKVMPKKFYLVLEMPFRFLLLLLGHW
jgi:hypothetical protein